VTTIGQIAQNIYKGARFKREDLETEERTGPEVKVFLTPGALLQERAESIKYFDLSRASEKRKRTILRHVLRRGQILVTRSGSIGRVIYVTRDQESHIGSDDLIRIEIEDEDLRLYVYGYLKTKLGQDQMKRSEYGTIQQHVEPRHVADIVIPIPDDMQVIRDIGSRLRESIESKERSSEFEKGALDDFERLHGDLSHLEAFRIGAN